MDVEGNLLIVDDSDADREMLSRRLQRKGYAVTGADCGRRGLELIAQQRFDLVLLDVVMPGMTGMEVLQTLRQTWSAADLPVIMVTGKNDSEDIVSALNSGASDYVTKPLDLPVVLARLQTQLSLSRAVEQIKRLERDLEQRNLELAATNDELIAANERMQRDLTAAARIQETLLPSAVPTGVGADFAWLLKPCSELGGDTLNVFALDDNYIGMYVVDVAGHGVAAALLTVPISRALSPTARSSVLWQGQPEDGRRVVSPAEVASQLNRTFPWDSTTRQFFTLIYGVLNLRTREWRYVSAGHTSPIYLARDAAAPVRLTGQQGVAIGLAEAAYQEGVVTLRPGDRLYLYSDGIPEAVNAEGGYFGYERMMAALAETRKDPLTDSVASLWRSVEAWCEGSKLQDDVSLLCLEIADWVATATG